MQDTDEINRFDHAIVYIWRSTGGGGRGVGHVAANLHLAQFNKNIFVSLWPGDEDDEEKSWHKDFNEVFNAEHDHEPNQTLVFYMLDIPAMMARFNTLKIQTQAWVMMPKKDESLNLESLHHNCCTAVWSVLKAGRIKGTDGIFSDKEFDTVLRRVKAVTLSKGCAQVPHSSSQFFSAASKSQDSNQTTMVASGPSTLTWETLLSGERYGPDVLYEILTATKKQEVERMIAKDPHDPRLIVEFKGHENLTKRDGVIDTKTCAVETTEFTAATLMSKIFEKGCK